MSHAEMTIDVKDEGEHLQLMSARNGQPASAADDVESENPIVSVALTEGEKPGKHVDRDIEIAAVEYVGNGSVWARRTAQTGIWCVNNDRVSVRYNSRTKRDHGKHR